jgi:hypothetical protein
VLPPQAHELARVLPAACGRWECNAEPKLKDMGETKVYNPAVLTAREEQTCRESTDRTAIWTPANGRQPSTRTARTASAGHSAEQPQPATASQPARAPTQLHRVCQQIGRTAAAAAGRRQHQHQPACQCRPSSHSQPQPPPDIWPLNGKTAVNRAKPSPPSRSPLNLSPDKSSHDPTGFLGAPARPGPGQASAGRQTTQHVAAASSTATGAPEGLAAAGEKTAVCSTQTASC